MPKGSNNPSVMSHDFSRIPAPQIQRSSFDRTYTHKTALDAGYLVPIHLDEVLPGDTISMHATLFGRLSTMIFPIMDNVFLDTFFFFVPNRLLWSNWERMQGAQDDPEDSIDFEVPVLAPLGDPPGGFVFATGSLHDYMGLPTGVAIATVDSPTALFHRGYHLIWNSWFRDQNLQDSVTVPLGDGPDDFEDYVLLRRGKRHDYFTSCLPWPQKGDAVALPLTGNIPVVGDGQTMGLQGTNAWYLNFNDNAGFQGSLGVTNTSGSIGGAPLGTTSAGDVRLGLHTNPALTHVYADISNIVVATINDLREAFAFQQILETDARGGTRYTEILKAHFGVSNGDARLQRPEYLGGSSQRVDVSGVAQTSSTDATTPQGNLSAYAQVGSQSGFTRSFTEHGIIIGLANVRADITYQQGMHRMFSRRTRYDFYMPALAHLGEQPVYLKELIYTNTGLDANEVFGYQERWAEYRYQPSRISGIMRTQASGSLDAWHLALSFAEAPSLGDTFIQDDPPIDRVIAVPAEPHLLLDCYFKQRAARPMPMYSVPGLQRL